MKVMNCKELGGACDLEFRASSFDEIAELSKQHGIEMYQQKEPAHLEAMQEMQNLMKDPQKMNEWFEAKKKKFAELPES